MDVQPTETEPLPQTLSVGPRVRTGLALLVALLLLSGVAAMVTVGGDSRSPQEVIAAVPAAASEVRTMAMEMRMVVQGPFKIETTARGFYDLDTGESSFTVGVGDTAMEMRTVAGVLYMKTPATNGDERWLASPLPKGANATPLLQTDPSSYLELMRAVSSEVEEVGREEVRGVQTTHYRFEIDPRKVESPIGQFSVSDLSAAGIATLPLDVWVGDDDLPRRIRMALGAPDSDIEIDIEMYDYGKPVNVEAPPADLVQRVASAEELIAQAGRTNVVGSPTP